MKSTNQLIMSLGIFGVLIFGIWFGHILGRVDVFAQCGTQQKVNLDAMFYTQATITCELKPLKKNT